MTKLILILTIIFILYLNSVNIQANLVPLSTSSTPTPTSRLDCKLILASANDGSKFLVTLKLSFNMFLDIEFLDFKVLLNFLMFILKQIVII